MRIRPEKRAGRDQNVPGLLPQGPPRHLPLQVRRLVAPLLRGHAGGVQHRRVRRGGGGHRARRGDASGQRVRGLRPVGEQLRVLRRVLQDGAAAERASRVSTGAGRCGLRRL